MPDEANEAPKPFQAIPEQPGSTVPETQARGGCKLFGKELLKEKQEDKHLKVSMVML